MGLGLVASGVGARGALVVVCLLATLTPAILFSSSLRGVVTLDLDLDLDLDPARGVSMTCTSGPDRADACSGGPHGCRLGLPCER